MAFNLKKACQREEDIAFPFLFILVSLSSLYLPNPVLVARRWVRAPKNAYTECVIITVTILYLRSKFAVLLSYLVFLEVEIGVSPPWPAWLPCLACLAKVRVTRGQYECLVI